MVFLEPLKEGIFSQYCTISTDLAVHLHLWRKTLFEDLVKYAKLFQYAAVLWLDSQSCSMAIAEVLTFVVEPVVDACEMKHVCQTQTGGAAADYDDFEML